MKLVQLLHLAIGYHWQRNGRIFQARNQISLDGKKKIGSAAVQIAKNHFGAKVTGVCSTPRLEFVKSPGADKVIDYTKEDFSQNGETYDLILDILGKISFSRRKSPLSQNGRYLLAIF